MFQISEDFDFNVDFLGTEFEEELFCGPTNKKVKSDECVPGEFNIAFKVKGPVSNANCDNSAQNNVINQNGSRSYYKVPSKGSECVKIPRSPLVAQNRNVIPFKPHEAKSLDTSQLSSSIDNGFVGNNVSTTSNKPYNFFECASYESRSTPRRDSKNAAFLAEWNDNNSLFNSRLKGEALAGGENLQVSSSRLENGSYPTELVVKLMQKNVRPRRFPGPAGLLPPRQGCTPLIATEEFLNELNSERNEQAHEFDKSELLSQSSSSGFEGSAWSAMLEDLGGTGLPLLNSMNLAAVKGVGGHLKSYKVPFLAVLVESIDASLPDASVRFKDPTGSMHGVIHRDVWEQFSSDIAVGTVLVLRNVGIIHAGISSRKYVLNITGNNLISIYSPKDEFNVQLRKIHAFAANSSSALLTEWSKVEKQSTTLSPAFNKSEEQSSFPKLFSSYSQFNSTATVSSPINNRKPKPHARDPTAPSPFAPVQNRSIMRSSPRTVINNETISFTGNCSNPIQRPYTNPTTSLATSNSQSLNTAPQPSKVLSFTPKTHGVSSVRKVLSTNQFSDCAQKKQKVSQMAVHSSSNTNPLRNNLFQVDEESSVVDDTLFEGIDTDSLFGEF